METVKYKKLFASALIFLMLFLFPIFGEIYHVYAYYGFLIIFLSITAYRIIYNEKKYARIHCRIKYDRLANKFGSWHH